MYYQLVRWTERGADTAVRRKKKTVETGCVWVVMITAAGHNGPISLWEVVIIIIIATK